MAEDAYIAAHADDEQQRFAQLLKIDFPTPVYWTDHGLSVFTGAGLSVGAHTWTRRGFTISGITSRHGEISGQATLVVANADNVVSALVYAGAIVGIGVHVYHAQLVAGGATMVAQGIKCVFEGTIDTPTVSSASGSAPVVTFRLAGYSDPLARMFPTRRIANKCDVRRLGDARCQYAGAETDCDRTLARCTVLGNQTHYGGFQPFPRISTQEGAV